MESNKRDSLKHCRRKSDATEHDISSGATLFYMIKGSKNQSQQNTIQYNIVYIEDLSCTSLNLLNELGKRDKCVATWQRV